MERIASFTVDHTKLTPGMYISRIDQNVITYDLRMCWPNAGKYLENAALHTVEHLLATFLRNSACAESIVYVGPMGCRTGFYLLTFDTLTNQQAIDQVREGMQFVAQYDGVIPGSSEVECGNYRDHNLEGAKKIAKEYGAVLQNWSVNQLKY